MGVTDHSSERTEETSAETPGTTGTPSSGRAPLEGQALYQLLVESVQDYAIFALDPSGVVITWNDGAQRLKGYRPEEIIGRHFSIFYPHVDIAAGKPSWELDEAVAKGRVDIRVEHEPAARWTCPQCQRELACRDHAEERVWRHLDTCQFGTYVHARIPRVDCPEHGVVQVNVPWAAARSRFTLLMERWSIDVTVAVFALIFTSTGSVR